MEVIVQVRPRQTPQATRTTRAASDVAPPAVFRTVEEEYGVTLRPMHPNAHDAVLCTYYYANVTDEATAHEVLTRLRRSTRIEAAYVKPADEMPTP